MPKHKEKKKKQLFIRESRIIEVAEKVIPQVVAVALELYDLANKRPKQRI